LQSRFPDVKMGSYPQMGQTQVLTELVLRSADEALRFLLRRLSLFD
jgi:hypothetical protein